MANQMRGEKRTLDPRRPNFTRAKRNLREPENPFSDRLKIYTVFNIGATKPIFLDFGSPRGGGGVRACVRGYGLLSLYCSYTKFK